MSEVRYSTVQYSTQLEERRCGTPAHKAVAAGREEEKGVMEGRRWRWSFDHDGAAM